MAVKTNPTTGKSPAAAWPRRKSAWKRTLKCRSSSVKTVNLVFTKSMSKTTWSISLTLLAPENWKHVCQVLQKPMQIKGKCFLLWSNLDLSNGSNSPHLGTSWLSTLVCFGEHRISPNQSARAGIVSHDQTGSEWDALWNCKALPLHCVTGSSKSRLSPSENTTEQMQPWILRILPTHWTSASVYIHFFLSSVSHCQLSKGKKAIGLSTTWKTHVLVLESKTSVTICAVESWSFTWINGSE